MDHDVGARRRQESELGLRPLAEDVGRGPGAARPRTDRACVLEEVRAEAALGHSSGGNESGVNTLLLPILQLCPRFDRIASKMSRNANDLGLPYGIESTDIICYLRLLNGTLHMMQARPNALTGLATI
jgi:hypothetical protein